MSISVYAGRGTIPSDIPAEMVILSRDTIPVTASGGTVADAISSNYQSYWSPGADTGTLTFDLRGLSSAQKSAMLLHVENHTRPSYDNPVSYGVPSAYTFDMDLASGSSPSGSWTNLVTVTGNTTSNGLKSFGIHTGLNLSSAGWARLNITGSAGNGINLQVDLRDARFGTDDIIVFFGDSNTMQAYNRVALNTGSPFGAGEGPLESLLEGFTGRDTPVIVNAGTGGWISANAITDIDQVTTLPGKYAVINFGTNDGNGGTMSSGALDTFEANIRAGVAACRDAGKTVLLPTVPWGSSGNLEVNSGLMNARIAAIIASPPTGATVLPGADLYAVSNGQQNLIVDGLHFSYDPAVQAVTSSHPLGLPNGLSGYEAVLRVTALNLVEQIYTA